MLPSGNDAAYTLGEYLGALLASHEGGGGWREEEGRGEGCKRDEEEVGAKRWEGGGEWRRREEERVRRKEEGRRREEEGIRRMEEGGRREGVGGKRILDLKKDFSSVKDPMKLFLGEMGVLCHNLGLTESVFQNVHGMSTKINMSTANDVGLMTCYALKNDCFAKIVRTKTYSCWIYGENERPVRWENLNKLLDYGFHGVKTGITPNAGKHIYTGYESTLLQVRLVCYLISCYSYNIYDRSLLIGKL